MRHRRPTVQAQRVALRARAELRCVWFSTHGPKDDDVGRQIFMHDVFRAAVDVLLVRAAPEQTGLVCAVEDGRGQGVSVQRHHGHGVRMRDSQQRRRISPSEVGERRDGGRFIRGRHRGAYSEAGGVGEERRWTDSQVR
jgi:hypothetical protein